MDTEGCHICGHKGGELLEYYLDEANIVKCCLLSLKGINAIECPTCKRWRDSDKEVCFKCCEYDVKEMTQAFVLGKPMLHFMLFHPIHKHGTKLPEIDAFSVKLMTANPNVTCMYIGRTIPLLQRFKFNSAFPGTLVHKHTTIYPWTGGRPVLDEKEFEPVFKASQDLLKKFPATGIARITTVCWMMDQLCKLGIKLDVVRHLCQNFVPYITKSEFTEDETIYAALEQVNGCRRMAADFTASVL